MKKIALFFLCLTQCYADPVILGGTYGSGETPLIDTFSTPGLAASSVAIPVGNTGSIYSVAMGVDGSSVLGGETDDGKPLAYKVLAGSGIATPITGMTTNVGYINDVAIGPDGTVIMVGTNYTSGVALIYRVNAGSTEAISITPPTVTGIHLDAVAIGPDGTAIMGGYSSEGVCIIYLAPGAMSATSVGLPSSAVGRILSIAIDSHGTAIIGGATGMIDTATPLYWLPQGASTATFITSSYSASINGVAIGSNGTAIAGGQSIEDDNPIIYQILAGSTVATTVSGITSYRGEINGVAIGPDGTAVAVGGNQNSHLPVVYRITSAGGGEATNVSIPSGISGGSFLSVAIDSAETAILGGIDRSEGKSQIPLICILGSTDTVATRIANPNANQGRINSVATSSIYSNDPIPPEGLYNIDRIRPIYEAELYETKNKLHQAGL